MKNKVYMFAIAVLISVQGFSQSPNWQWAQSAGGNHYDWGRGVTTDADGNVIVTGYFGIDPITFGTTMLSNSGADDFFLAKYDAAGEVLWARRAGGSDLDRGESVATDADGNIFVTGHYKSTSITFGSYTLANAGNIDAFIVKYDPSGNVLWAKNAGGSADDFGQSIATDSHGNVVLAGYYISPTITIAATTLTNTSSNSTVPDAFIIKYDPSGNLLWAKSAGGGSYDYDYAYGVSVDKADNLFITGYFTGVTMTFGAITLNRIGDANMFIAKYNSAGDEAWAKNFGGAGTAITEGFGITNDAAGNIYATGWFVSTVAFGSETLTNLSAFYPDLYLVKYDTLGNVIWAKSASGTANEYGRSLSTGSDGSIYITGEFYSPSVNFGGNSIINADNSSSTTDIFVAQYDSLGNSVWAVSIGGMADEFGRCITTDAGGNIYITGDFSSSSVDFGANSLTNTYANRSDFFLAKSGNSTAKVEEHIISGGTNIYPNPGEGIFTIVPEAGISNIEIVNVYGDLVLSAQVDAAHSEINLSRKAKGVYFFTLTGAEKKTTTGKLVIE